MMVSGLNHLLGRVKRSDLVQSGWDTSPDVVEIISLLERPENTHLGPFGPVGAFGGL